MRNDEARNSAQTPGWRPPPILEVPLRTILPKGITGESILGDLREEYSSDRSCFSPFRANLRYFRKALSIGVHSLSRTRPQYNNHQKKKDQGGRMSGFLPDLRQALRRETDLLG